MHISKNKRYLKVQDGMIYKRSCISREENRYQDLTWKQSNFRWGEMSQKTWGINVAGLHSSTKDELS